MLNYLPRSDLLGVFLSCIILIVHFFGSKWISRYIGPSLRRTLTHIGGGLWVVLWYIYASNIIASLFPLIVTAFFILAPKEYRDLFSSADETHTGLITYGIGLTIVTFMFFNSSYGAAGILSLALGDGLGDLIGRNFGRHRYKLPWMKGRTIEGSLAVFVGALLAGFLASRLFNPSFPIVFILANAVLVTIIEALSPSHGDNIGIPVISSVFLYLVAL